MWAKQLKSNNIFLTTVVAAGICLELLLLLLQMTTTFAATTAGWQAGRIIDDSIFFDKNSMSVMQIQEFLNARVPVCENWHAQGGYSQAPPYTCLKQYQENTSTLENNYGKFNGDGSPVSVPGGKSAAQIIYDAAQTYGISPKVLLVLLQKEQILVTDTWPLYTQFQKATGYACPDTAPCNTKYYGFFNQVESAAWQFTRYAINSASYTYKPGVTRYIGYNPNASCGGTDVYIQNQATANLYNYTPYQPNAGALAAGYGTAPCGAYGNRNFYLYYNDWFGSTYSGVNIETATNDVFNIRNKPTTIDSYVLRQLRRAEVTSFGCYQTGGSYTIDGLQNDSWIRVNQPVSGWMVADTTTVTSAIAAGSKQCQPGKTPVYRAYNPFKQRHFWTIDPSERNFVLNALHFTEGSPSFNTVSEGGEYIGTPVYRLYNRKRETHFWTADPAERAFVKTQLGFEDEGFAFSAMYGSQGSVPVWRFYDPIAERHFWTADPNERDFVTNALHFRFEGEAFRIPQ